jgi:aspartate aminotransferase-like enzyme
MCAGLSPKEWTSVPLQGSGTFAVEAVVNTCMPRLNQQKVIR